MPVLTSKFTNNKKLTTMKKFIAILAVAGVMTACGGAKTEEVKVDSAAAKVDTAAKKLDSAAAKVDSAAKKVDSVIKK